MTITHDELVENLYRAKGGGFLNIPLGSVWKAIYHNHQYDVKYGNKSSQKVYRADLVRIRPSYTRFCIDIFEVKISRSDFLSDIRTKKWMGYLPHCHRFYFAIKSGVADLTEIPDGVGLMVYGGKGWRTIKGAENRSPEIPAETLLSLIFYKQRRNTHRYFFSSGDYFEMNRMKKRLKRFGESVASQIVENATNKMFDER
jgi:hypothetical protein